MIRIFVLLMLSTGIVCAQNTSRIFAHNDYATSRPFELAYSLQVGYIEADIFLRGDALLVAHHQLEIRKERTLDAMYLEPLRKKVRENGGSVYGTSRAQLTLMIDLKSDGAPTLQRLVEVLRGYPELTGCATLSITVSGNMPATSTWHQYPDFISFDGRPSQVYTTAELKRVKLISDNCRNYSNWDGTGELPQKDDVALREVINKVHQQGKLLRLWAAPDNPAAWKKWTDLGIDIINTDRVVEVAAFINSGPR